LGGAYALSGSGAGSDLALGATVSAANTFGSGSTAKSAQWLLNSADSFFGFRFINEAGGGTLHYGWAQIAFGSTLTSRTLVQYAFEAAPMTAVAVVPKPGTFALMGLGLLGVVAARRRMLKEG
jgi:hypothetical protein